MTHIAKLAISKVEAQLLLKALFQVELVRWDSKTQRTTEEHEAWRRLNERLTNILKRESVAAANLAYHGITDAQRTKRDECVAALELALAIGEDGPASRRGEPT
jgi:hypothetical protein